MLQRLSALAFVLSLGACATPQPPPDPPPVVVPEPPPEPASAPEPEKITTASGLVYQDFKEGDGPSPSPGQLAVIHYEGWLSDGTEIGTSRGDAPIVFPMGAGRVIRGWEEGVSTMKVGGRRRLIVPAVLGYGDKGIKDIIAPGATLVYDIELLEIRPGAG